MPELTNLFVFSNGVVRRNYRFLRVIFLILFLYKRLMNPNFKSNERELVKIAGFFKRQSRKLIDAGKLDKEHEQVGEAVDRFIATIEDHANVRARILDDRQTRFQTFRCVFALCRRAVASRRRPRDDPPPDTRSGHVLRL